MKIVVIGGSGLIGSKLVSKLGEHGHDGDRGVARLRRQHAHGRRARRGARGRCGGRRRLERARVGGRRGDGVLQDVDRQPPCGGVGRGSRASRGAVGRRHRAPDGERLLPREARPGEADRRVLDPVLDRPRDAVLRVHEAHRRGRDRRQHRPPPAGADPADGRRRRRERGRARVGRRAAQRDGGGRGARAVPPRRAHPWRADDAQRSARRRDRSAGALLRHQPARATRSFPVPTRAWPRRASATGFSSSSRPHSAQA